MLRFVTTRKYIPGMPFPPVSGSAREEMVFDSVAKGSFQSLSLLTLVQNYEAEYLVAITELIPTVVKYTLCSFSAHDTDPFIKSIYRLRNVGAQAFSSLSDLCPKLRDEQITRRFGVFPTVLIPTLC